MKTHSLFPITLAAVFISTGASAQEKADAITFSGFATLGAIKTDSNDGEFVTPGQVSGATRSPSWGVDSKLGVQATGVANDMVSGTVQIVSKHNGEGNYRPGVEWVFARFSATPALAFRAGRMGLPAFAVSDFRDVNFANLWMRPPLDVYGVLPVSHFDGADAIYTLPLGGSTVTTQVYGGRATATYDEAKVTLGSLIGINSTVEFDNGLTLRLGHFKSDMGIEGAGQVTAHDRRTRFSGVGLVYDKGNVVANAEYVFGKRHADTVQVSPTGWYTSLGYRLGKFTPYAVTSRYKAALDMALPDGSKLGLLSGQRTNSLGVRWDAWRNTDVKFQFDRVRVGSFGGQFADPTPALVGKSVNVFGVSADVVF